MRKIQRNEIKMPESFRSLTIREASSEIFEYYKLPTRTRHQTRLPFSDYAYLADDVEASLKQLFDNKCAYCETKSKHLFIDHFRPYSSARNNSAELGNPDYYGWFFYEWENLFLICSACNRNKQNLFPVDGPRASILSSWSEANDFEKGTILNPCFDDPFKHLDFSVTGLCNSKTNRGKKTIEVLKLNRDDLMEQRSAIGKTLLNEILLLKNGQQMALTRIVHFMDGASEHSGFCSNLLKKITDNIAIRHGLRKPSTITFLEWLPDLLKSLPTNVDLSDLTHDKNIRNDSYEVLLDEGERYIPFVQDYNMNSSPISRIHIRNFKGIEELSFTLENKGNKSQCLMLLGENATGKSSILQALSLCLMGKTLRKRLNINLQDFISRDEKWRYSGQNPASVEIFFEDGISTKLEFDPIGMREVNENPIQMLVYSYGSRRFFDSQKVGGRKIDHVRSLFDPISTLPNPANWLQGSDETVFNAVARVIKEIFVLDKEDQLFRDEEGRVWIRAHGRDTPLERLSDGYKSLFSMIIDLAKDLLAIWGDVQIAKGVVIIDEIENHLHPRWKIQVITALRKAFPQVQFIVTTHDPLCLKGMLEGEVEVLYRNNKNVIEKMNDLPNAAALRSEQLLVSDYFGLVSTEDSRVELILNEYAELISKNKNSLDTAQFNKVAEIEEFIQKNLLLGDNPVQQIGIEAVSRYLIERNHRNKIDRDQVKEEAVKAIIDALKEFEEIKK